nr:MAG TPA: hypothetical protein [Caudoviricetes sp.]
MFTFLSFLKLRDDCTIRATPPFPVVPAPQRLKRKAGTFSYSLLMSFRPDP